jgi:hypothetical protein
MSPGLSELPLWKSLCTPRLKCSAGFSAVAQRHYSEFWMALRSPSMIALA